MGVNYSCLFVSRVLGGTSDEVSYEWFRPFPLQTNEMLHIGKLIREELFRQERTVTWFAQKLYCERTNVYNIFKRKSIDTELLLRISQILDHDFFKVYQKEMEKNEK